MQLPETWLFDALKLFAQLVGALVVAWFTVRWALKRFKREKSWERKSELYADILQGLTAMQSSVDDWIRAKEEQFAWTETFEVKLNERYRTGFERLEQGSALATLLLSAEAAATLQSFFAAMKQIDEEQSAYGIHCEQAEKIGAAICRMIEHGKAELSTL